MKDKKAKKYLALLAFLAVAAIVLTGGWFAWVYVASERYLADVAPGPAFDYPVSTDPAVIERGRHMARTRGCFGCHGQQLQGRSFAEEWPEVGVAVAPNLAKLAREQEPAVLEAAIRQGIGHQGKALWSMPAYNFVHLGDEDVAAVISFLRSAPVVEADLPEPGLSWGVRIEMSRGTAQHMADWAEAVPPLLLGPDADPQLRRGQYIAFTTCNECHGFDLRGSPDLNGTPDLAILGGYPDEPFRTLMQHGEGIGGRTDLGLMTEVAQGRFAYFTEDELTDLLAFLRTLPGYPADREAAWRNLR